MLHSVICTFILNVIIVGAIKFHPTEVGIGGSEQFGIVPFGEKYTNVEYGSGVGYPHGLGQTAYAYNPKIAYGGGYAAHSPNIAYNVPKAAGFGPAGVGHESFVLGYKGTEGLGIGSGQTLGGIGYAPKIGAVGIHSAGIGYGGVGGGIGYGDGVQGVGYGHYPAVGIAKGPGYGYGPGVGYGIPHAGGLVSTLGHGGLGVGGGNFIGGSQIDKNIYNAENRNVIGDHYSASHGKNGEVLNHGDAGFTTGQVALKDIKGETVHFSDTDGVNNAHHAGKAYHGGEHFDKGGKHGAEQVLNENHKKGHNIKSFKKSHHLDESGKTEEFYDEDHDEGGNYAFDGHVGKFGQSGKRSKFSMLFPFRERRNLFLLGHQQL
nr:fibroin heavy chain-like [Leptinotarsa decemlineata]